MQKPSNAARRAGAARMSRANVAFAPLPVVRRCERVGEVVAIDFAFALTNGAPEAPGGREVMRGLRYTSINNLRNS